MFRSGLVSFSKSASTPGRALSASSKPHHRFSAPPIRNGTGLGAIIAILILVQLVDTLREHVDDVAPGDVGAGISLARACARVGNLVRIPRDPVQTRGKCFSRRRFDPAIVLMANEFKRATRVGASDDGLR